MNNWKWSGLLRRRLGGGGGRGGGAGLEALVECRRDLGEARDLPGVAHQTNSLMAPMTVTPAAAAL